MPNWCHNTLEVRGREEDVHGWVEKAASFEHAELDPQPLWFEAFVQPPGRFASSPKKLISWRYNNWGTKWEPRVLDIKRSPGRAEYRFHTAWSPPLEWLEIVARKHPELEFHLQYSEPGMNFAGEIIFREAEVIFEDNATFEETYA